MRAAVACVCALPAILTLLPALVGGCGGRASQAADAGSETSASASEGGGTGGDGSAGRLDDSSRPGCTPIPGCSSETICSDPRGCGTCTCEDGGWSCSDAGCPDATVPEDASTPVCPPQPPEGACSQPNQTCAYLEAGTCGGAVCTCDGGSWQCSLVCSTPTCPADTPDGGTVCTEEGESCIYPPSPSQEECTSACECLRGHWECALECPPNASCPVFPPDQGSACVPSSVGDYHCGYSINGGCAVENCACSASTPSWDCTYSLCSDAGEIDGG